APAFTNRRRYEDMCPGEPLLQLVSSEAAEKGGAGRSLALEAVELRAVSDQPEASLRKRARQRAVGLERVLRLLHRDEPAEEDDGRDLLLGHRRVRTRREPLGDDADVLPAVVSSDRVGARVGDGQRRDSSIGAEPPWLEHVSAEPRGRRGRLV